MNAELIMILCIQEAEEGFSFIVELVSVGVDALLNPNSRVATVNVLASDYVRGLVQVAPTYRSVCTHLHF